ncbi:MAG TPA: nucleotidyltransferase domain-containing protein [Ktedonobacteraceae bacterium]|nr:nucleotidyltransferase domain-containing protein [Ktedonobacteraceae bacterium]
MLLEERATAPGTSQDFSVQRPGPVTAAHMFVRDYYPAALGAILSGSQAWHQGHRGSDLDIVILNSTGQPHWATFDAYGWPIEAFVMTLASYAGMFAVEAARRWPIYLRMSAEGMILCDQGGQVAQMQQDARQLMAAGPTALNAEEIAQARYHLTSVIADMSDIEDIDEIHILAQDLVASLIDSYLGYSRHWLGNGKWRWRYLRHCNPHVAAELSRAMSALYQYDDREPLLNLAGSILSLLGGPLFTGRYTAY